MNQPPDVMTLDWCDRCGQTNRHKSLRGKHYVRGALCSGKLIQVIYKNTGNIVLEETVPL